MKIIDILNYDLVVLYGMGQEGIGLYRKIKNTVTGKLLFFDKQVGTIDSYAITQPDFSLVSGNHIVVITPLSKKYCEEMKSNVPDNINLVFFSDFEEYKSVNNIYQSCKLKPIAKSNQIYNAFHNIKDEDYIDLLIRAYNEPVINGVTMPAFPSLELMTGSVGMTNPKELKYGPARFTGFIKQCAIKYGGFKIAADTKILDFGVGFGRMVRFFFKDILSNNIFGTDIMQLMIDTCNALLPAGNYSLNAPTPPAAFPNNTFDIIYAYSVFSHLNPSVAVQWIEEFARILKPGGIVVATTEGKRFIELCEKLQRNPELVADNYWFKALYNSFTDTNTLLQDYNSGKAIFHATGGGDGLDKSFYGDTVLPKEYIADVFGKILSFKEFVEYADEQLLSQPIFVLQK